ncbi:MAG: NAD(P)H-quinone oxidoreductase [Thermoanaerobaculia bacterium]
MRAVRPHAPGLSGGIEIVDLPAPRPAAGEVLVRVLAAGLNRADLLQMRGGYPPPPGASAVPGLECAGIVEECGEGVTDWRPGDRVMALLTGGGQAELVAVPSGQLMLWPASLPVAEAGGIPEAAITSWTNLVQEGGLAAGERLLVLGATSGVGSFAVQLARELGAGLIVAAGRSAERLRTLSEYGIDRHVVLGDDFARTVLARTGEEPIDLVLDLVGGEWTARALETLAPRGRLVLVGLTAGSRAEVDLAIVLRRRLRITGSILRARPRAEKAALVAAFSSFAGGRLAAGTLRPRIHATWPLERAVEAYAAMAAGGFTGKLVLTP